MKVRLEASDKRRLWPWVIFAVLALVVGEIWILSQGARVWVLSKPIKDPLIEGFDCYYFTGTWFEGPFDVKESCPFLAPDRWETWR